MPKFLSSSFWPLAAASGLIHSLLFFTAENYGRVAPFNDVLLYGWWLFNMQGGDLLGISTDWVYPYPALVPMFLAMVLGAGQNILAGWVLLLFLLNTLLIGQLIDWGRAGRETLTAAWFWLAFILLLGPVAIGRIDAVATAIAGFGLIAISRNRFSQAMVYFTLGAWVKIWPVAMALGLFISRVGRVALFRAAIIVVGSVFGFGLLLGGGASLLSFVSTQGTRGIQIEAPVATFWLWDAKLGSSGSGIYFDQQLLTNQVSGPWVAEVSQLMTIAMAVALVITALLGWRAFKAGVDSNKLLAAVALTAVLDLIVFNKVGSPQFMGWLAVPIMAAIIFDLDGWKVPMISGLALAGVTFMIYPLYYLDLMGLGWLSIGLLTVRNIGLVLLLIWANRKLIALVAKPGLV